MPRRQPRWPSIGLNSCSSSTRASRRAAASRSLRAGRRSALGLRLLLRQELDLGLEARDVDDQLLAPGQELVQRRVERADGDREPVHRLEQAVEVARAGTAAAWRARSCKPSPAALSFGLGRRQLPCAAPRRARASLSRPRASSRAATSAAQRLERAAERIICTTCGSRSSAKNMCSVRHRPMPSAPNSRAFFASRGDVGVGAHLEAADLVGRAP